MNDQFRLIHGNALDELKKLPAESIDSVVCDPPYELGFMGKKWDSSGIAYNVDLWREVLRVLKPGGHLAAFGGTRTYHRMAVAIEDAGFEIRDQMAWAYGSGFPKSLDVAKSIDASDRLGFARDRQLRFTAWMRSTGITSEEINTATASCMASHYLTDKEQPAVATEDMFSKLRPIIRARGHEIPAWVEELVQWRTVESENLKKRKITGTKTAVDLTKVRPVSLAAQGKDTSPTKTINLTESHTETAKKWEGWGTALKPAWEPIALARKPFKGTIAGNVVKHGTAALNINGCRVPYADAADAAAAAAEAFRSNDSERNFEGWGMKQNGVTAEEFADAARNGRFPANLMHDGSAEVVACFPDDGFASASRFFFRAAPTEIESLFSSAKAFLDEWNPDLASIAESPSSQLSRLVASALNLAVTEATRGDLSLAEFHFQEPFTSATRSELNRISETLIGAILSTAKNVSPVRLRGARFPNGVLVRYAERDARTDTMTITIDHWRSGGSAESVTFRVTPKNWADGAAVGNRFHYTAKASTEDREAGLELFDLKTGGAMTDRVDGSAGLQSPRAGAGAGRNGGRANTHPTVKPTDLMVWLVRLLTPPGGTCLDPFMGSGSTGRACAMGNFRFVGIDMTAEYIPIARARIEDAIGPLFLNSQPTKQ